MIDFYGRYRTTRYDEHYVDAPKPYETETKTTSDGDKTTKVVYTRFAKRANQPCAIWKQTYINENGTDTYRHEYAYAKWEDRANDSLYVPINECWKL